MQQKLKVPAHNTQMHFVFLRRFAAAATSNHSKKEDRKQSKKKKNSRLLGKQFC
jgi:hypothetical protein